MVLYIQLRRLKKKRSSKVSEQIFWIRSRARKIYELRIASLYRITYLIYNSIMGIFVCDTPDAFSFPSHTLYPYTDDGRLKLDFYLFLHVYSSCSDWFAFEIGTLLMFLQRWPCYTYVALSIARWKQNLHSFSVYNNKNSGIIVNICNKSLIVC